MRIKGKVRSSGDLRKIRPAYKQLELAMNKTKDYWNKYGIKREGDKILIKYTYQKNGKKKRGIGLIPPYLLISRASRNGWIISRKNYRR